MRNSELFSWVVGDADAHNTVKYSTTKTASVMISFPSLVLTKAKVMELEWQLSKAIGRNPVFSENAHWNNNVILKNQAFDECGLVNEKVF